jgi:hypothetical protein
MSTDNSVGRSLSESTALYRESDTSFSASSFFMNQFPPKNLMSDSLEGPCEQINIFPSAHIWLLLNNSSLHIWRNSFPPCEDLKISDMLFTSQNTTQITLGNEQCLKLWVRNTKKSGDLSISLAGVNSGVDIRWCYSQLQHRVPCTMFFFGFGLQTTHV